MTSQPQQEYIITEEELKTWETGKWKGKRYNQTWLREIKLPEIRSCPAPSAPTDEQCWICSVAICNQMLEDTRAKIKWVRTSPTFEIMMERLLEWSTEVKDSLRREVPE